MDVPHHRFNELFQPADVGSIQRFLERCRPLDAAIRLEDAPFWTAAQATLLRDELLLDADWAEVVDQLNAALRGAAGR